MHNLPDSVIGKSITARSAFKNPCRLKSAAFMSPQAVISMCRRSGVAAMKSGANCSRNWNSVHNAHTSAGFRISGRVHYPASRFHWRCLQCASWSSCHIHPFCSIDRGQHAGLQRRYDLLVMMMNTHTLRRPARTTDDNIVQTADGLYLIIPACQHRN